MGKLVDNQNNVHSIDNGNNHFINGKCVNPKSWESTPIGATLKEHKDLKSLSLALGHVPNFTYNQGKELITVQTGLKAW